MCRRMRRSKLQYFQELDYTCMIVFQWSFLIELFVYLMDRNEVYYDHESKYTSTGPDWIIVVYIAIFNAIPTAEQPGTIAVSDPLP